MEESEGIIGIWEDFEAYPWPDADKVSLAAYEYASQRLPEGMGMLVCFGQGTLENVMNVLVGLEPLSYMLYEQPDLVEAIFEKVGQILYRLSERLIGLPKLAGFFQGDDMGYQSATLISPDHIRKDPVARPVVDKIDQIPEHKEWFAVGCDTGQRSDRSMDVRYDEQESAFRLGAQPDRHANEPSQSEKAGSEGNDRRPASVEGRYPGHAEPNCSGENKSTR